MYNTESCIQCGSTDNLNTTIIIIVDGNKITLPVCDDHADDMSPKIAKELYMEKNRDLLELMQKAKEMGLELVQSGKLQIAQSVEQRPQSDQPAKTGPRIINVKEERLKAEMEGATIISKSKYNQIASQTNAKLSGTASAEDHSRYINVNSDGGKINMNDVAGEVKMDVAQGRQGQPLAIPSIIKDETGTTTIRIDNSFDDRALRDRTKKIIANEVSFGGGYTRDAE